MKLNGKWLRTYVLVLSLVPVLGAIKVATANPNSGPPGVLMLPDSRRNVLLIIADDVGVDSVSTYVDYYATSNPIGTTNPPRTETLDALAGAGVMFVNAWSSPLCSPTRAGVYTGTYAFHNGVYHPFAEGVSENMSADATTIAEILSKVDYKSGLFGKWHLGSDVDPIDQGWVRFAGSLAGVIDDYFAWYKVTDTVYTSEDAYARGHGEGDVGNYATLENVDDAVDWINSRSGRWMATVAFNASHFVGAPGTGEEWVQGPPEECNLYRPWVEEGAKLDKDDSLARESYKATVECMDLSIQDLLDRIDSSRLERTTIIFIGDNGTPEEMTQHFADHHAKGSVYEGGVNVPFIIADGYALVHEGETGSGTGRVVGLGRQETALAQTVDLFATIAEIAGADATCGVDSVSLVPLLEGTATSVRTYAYTEYGESSDIVAIRSSTHKLVIKDYDSGSATRELYDLSSDRWEVNDLLADGASWAELFKIFRLQNLLSTIRSVPAACP